MCARICVSVCKVCVYVCTLCVCLMCVYNVCACVCVRVCARVCVQVCVRAHAKTMQSITSYLDFRVGDSASPCALTRLAQVKRYQGETPVGNGCCLRETIGWIKTAYSYRIRGEKPCLTLKSKYQFCPTTPCPTLKSKNQFCPKTSFSTFKEKKVAQLPVSCSGKKDCPTTPRHMLK